MVRKTNIKHGEKTMTNFEETLSNYVYYIQKLINANYAENLKNLTAPVVKVKKGRRFMKVVRGSSVHSFVEIKTGNVYKAASYKAAEMNHVRANIYDYESLKRGVDDHGAAYLR